MQVFRRLPYGADRVGRQRRARQTHPSGATGVGQGLQSEKPFGSGGNSLTWTMRTGCEVS
jgi:hypothetical protein